MKEKNRLSASLEDYMEVIYHIIEKKLVARSKEISSKLNVSRASVTEALRSLSQKGLINYAPYEPITLTEKGNEVAQDVIFRHETLKLFFTDVLAIDPKTAEEGACKIEHSAPEEIISQMISFMDFMKACPRGGDDFLKGFVNFCKKGSVSSNCTECIEQQLTIK